MASVVRLIFDSLSKTWFFFVFLLYNTMYFILLADSDFSNIDLVTSVQRDAYPKNQHLRAYHQKIDNNLGKWENWNCLA